MGRIIELTTGEATELIEHPNGYSGIIYGKSSISIYNAKGKEVMHSGHSSVRTKEAMMHCLDSFPQFIEDMTIRVDSMGI